MNAAISLLGRSPTPTTSRSRSSSYANIQVLSQESTSDQTDETHLNTSYNSAQTELAKTEDMDFSETSPLFGEKTFSNTRSGWSSYPQRITSGVIGGVRVFLTTITAPARYVIACFYDDHGHFSVFYPVISLGRALNPRRRRRGAELESQPSEKKTRSSRRSSKSTVNASSAVYSDSELDEKLPSSLGNRERISDSPSRHTRSQSRSSTDGDEIAPQRRSIRIKLHNEEALKRRRTQHQAKVTDAKDLVAASLKSPSSPLSSSTSSLKLTKFPRAPQPPRPLVPRRQNSYTKASPHDLQLRPRQKTLVIDLDETLIHSQSKGGRFAQGHMIEVKMNHSVGVGGVTLGPQVPILYYVHKRPHCDEFLRKVRILPYLCYLTHNRTLTSNVTQVQKWYKLVIFTASVQEYADPVIDWLELERPYFEGRYYRQHCTMRNGAYIKDLAVVEPDLSKVVILDNSPLSYVFHEGMFATFKFDWSWDGG